MSERPNPADFVVNEHKGEFYARFSVHGEIITKIDAATIEEARSKANAMCEDDEFGLEIDRIDMVDVDYVYPAPPMYYVLRDGQKMRVSHLQAGDTPRQPDERGF